MLKLKLSIPSGEGSVSFEKARARGEQEKENTFLSPPLALTSPFACGSRVTSGDSPKRRACAQANMLSLAFLKVKRYAP